MQMSKMAAIKGKRKVAEYLIVVSQNLNIYLLLSEI